MNVEEAIKLGIELEIPPGEKCPECGSPKYSCGSRQSVKSFHGKSYFKSSFCFSRGEASVLDQLQRWRAEEELHSPANVSEQERREERP
jgi:hypothetical protein